MSLWNLPWTNDLWQDATIIRFASCGWQIRGFPCDSYTYRGGRRSMSCRFGDRVLAPGRAFTRQSRPDATDRVRFTPARSMSRGGLLETGKSVLVSPVWTRATGCKPFTIDREPYANMSWGHCLTVDRALVHWRQRTFNDHLTWHHFGDSEDKMTSLGGSSNPAW